MNLLLPWLGFVLVLSTLIVLAVQALGPAFSILLISFAIAYVAHPFVLALEKTRIPRAITVLLVFLSFVSVVLLIGWGIIPPPRARSRAIRS